MPRSAVDVEPLAVRPAERRNAGALQPGLSGHADPQRHPAFIDEQADDAPTRYDDLRAVVFNGTLKRSPEPSQTDGLLAIPRGIIERVGVRVDVVRTVDHVIPPGVWPDMREHGYDATTSRRSTASSSSRPTSSSSPGRSGSATRARRPA